MLVVVENLRRVVMQIDEKTKPGEPALYGQWTKAPSRETTTLVGGPGYTLNRAAVKKFGEELVHVCSKDIIKANEDRLMSYCFATYGVYPGDTRDVETGEQQYVQRWKD
jgi:hypothetical protein